ncbi:MAG: CBS domain-containing protein, partial [Patescibacteria group bacterium]
MTWPKDSAGHRMTLRVPTASLEESVSSVRERIMKRIADYKTIDYIYVVDNEKKFVGVLSIKELFEAAAEKRIGEICKNTSLVAVRPETREEHAAYLAVKNNIKAIPVTDSAHVFLGVIIDDTILTILHREMHGNVFRLAGIRHTRAFTESILELPLLTSLWHRIPWLA